jgi:hypothetical protein
MENGILVLHNFMRWVVLVFALLTIFSSLSGMTSGKSFTSKNKRTALFLMISADIQLLLGLLLYFTRGWFNMLTGGGEVMKNAAARFWSVEHATGMIIALALIHIGYSAAKKDIPDSSKFRKLFWLTLIALVIILVTIPWPFREAVGRPWFPGMNI